MNLRLGLFFVLPVAGLGCSAARVADRSADSGSDADVGLPPPDTRGSPDGLGVTPVVSILRWNTAEDMQFEDRLPLFARDLATDADVTSSASWQVDKPAIAGFVGNELRLARPSPITGLGDTMLVTGSARGQVGHARVTVVRLRLPQAVDGKKDFLFVSPYSSAPSPIEDSLVFKTALGAGVGAMISFKLHNDPDNPRGFDATRLFERVRARSEGSPKISCDPHKVADEKTFTADSSPTLLCFALTAAKNETLPEQANAGFYRVFIDVVNAKTSAVLDTRAVIFLVPPTSPRIQ